LFLKCLFGDEKVSRNNGVAATKFSVVSETYITAVVPAGSDYGCGGGGDSGGEFDQQCEFQNFSITDGVRRGFAEADGTLKRSPRRPPLLEIPYKPPSLP
jgi:hypothetical protein